MPVLEHVCVYMKVVVIPKDSKAMAMQLNYCDIQCQVGVWSIYHFGQARAEVLSTPSVGESK